MYIEEVVDDFLQETYFFLKYLQLFIKKQIKIVDVDKEKI